MKALFARLRTTPLPSTREAIELLDRNPDLATVNGHLMHKSHNLRSVALDAAIAAGTPGTRAQ